MLNNLELVEIVWDDASCLDSGWFDPLVEKPTEKLAYTVGWLVADTDKYVVVAHTTDNTYVNGRFQIPKGMIKSMKPLRKKRKLSSKEKNDSVGNITSGTTLSI